jgi:hypothetical protein
MRAIGQAHAVGHARSEVSVDVDQQQVVYLVPPSAVEGGVGEALGVERRTAGGRYVLTSGPDDCVLDWETVEAEAVDR